MWVYKSAFYLRTNDFGNQSLFSLPGLLQSFLWHLAWDSGVTRSQGPSLSQVAFQQQHPASPRHPGRRLCPSHCPCCHTRVWCGGEERQGAGAGAGGMQRHQCQSEDQASDEPACTWLHAASRWRCCSPHAVWDHWTAVWVPAPNTLFLHRPLVDAEYLWCLLAAVNSYPLSQGPGGCWF